jgi:hypothetical protein
MPDPHYCRLRGVTADRGDPSRHISSRVRKIGPSLTLAITARAAAMARGEL